MNMNRNVFYLAHTLIRIISTMLCVIISVYVCVYIRVCLISIDH